MRTVNNLLQSVLNLSIEDVADKALAGTEEDYAIAQRDQMLHGLNADGESIGEYKNPAYKAKKMAMNPLADGSVDLKFEGDFHKGIFAIADNEGLRVGSFDIKSSMLQGNYGDKIWLLAPVN